MFDRHAPHIHRYLSRRPGRQVADDLLAETFLAAFAKRDRCDLAYTDARPWLYGIATNLVGQHRRDEARQYRLARAALWSPGPPRWLRRWRWQLVMGTAAVAAGAGLAIALLPGGAPPGTGRARPVTASG